MSNGFDRLARPYRWMEYLSFGRALERCRFHFVPDVANASRALLLGDGDGRFALELLRTAKHVEVHVVDASAGMLAALQQRCAAAGFQNRVHVYHAALPAGLGSLPAGISFDLVASHFFLDCLSLEEVRRLVPAICGRLRPEGCWLVSDFNIPAGAMGLPARILVRSLYLAFRVLAGLRVSHLPPYANVMEQHGLRRAKQQRSLGGILLSEIWVPADSLLHSAHGLESER